jgi:hypothetical protein
MRKELRAKNLHDTEDPPLSRQEIPANLDPALRHARTMDGTYNDLGAPQTPSAAHDTGALTVPSLESSHPADGHAIKLQQRRNGAA